MDAITTLVLLITLAAVVLYALYWVIRKAVRDEMNAPRGERPDPQGTSGPRPSASE